jgi:hypothetical protein
MQTELVYGWFLPRIFRMPLTATAAASSQVMTAPMPNATRPTVSRDEPCTGTFVANSRSPPATARRLPVGFYRPCLSPFRSRTCPRPA